VAVKIGIAEDILPGLACGTGPHKWAEGIAFGHTHRTLEVQINAESIPAENLGYQHLGYEARVLDTFLLEILLSREAHFSDGQKLV
jgi:hypothetical protein